MEINKTHELLLLYKTLSYLKFRSNELGSTEFSRSPITAELLEKISRELNGNRPSIAFEWDFNSLQMNVKERTLSIIKTHLSRVDNWPELSEEQKSKVLDIIAAPYQLPEPIFRSLIEARDEK